MHQKEIRHIAAQIRAASTGGGIGQLVGYASTFNSLSGDLGGFRERVAPGCFSNSLRNNADVRFLLNHDPSKILGRTKAGTLSLSEDKVGLRFACDLPDTSVGRDVYESVKRQDISQCSFAFTVDEGGDEWGEGEDPETNQRCAIRTLRSVSLMDVSAVTYPAYESSSVGVDPALVFGRSELVPVEVRKRAMAVRNLNPQDSRRKLFNMLLS